MIRAALAVAVAVVSGVFGGQTDGPLVTSSRVKITTPPLLPGEVFSWGAVLPPNPTAVTLVVEGVEPVAVRGLDVVGVAAGYPVLQPDGMCLAHGGGAARGFPPPGMTTHEVRGTRMPPWSLACGGQPYVTVGVRLRAGASSGSIDAIRVLYRYQGTLFAVVLPYSLEVPPHK